MWGDPSRGSSGVHEAGYTSFGLVPDAEYWWPTVTIVDGTLNAAPEKVEQVIDQAKRYAKHILVMACACWSSVPVRNAV